MPICRTCRGEYKTVAPPRRTSGTSASGNAPAAQPRSCSRCGVDLSVWSQLEITLPDFLIWEGGILGLLPAAAAIAVWLFWIPTEDSGNYFPVLTFVCLGLCALLFFMIYDSRLSWWEQLWASQIYRASRFSLDIWIVVTAIGGLLFSPLWVLYYTSVGRPADFTSKAFFALIYALAFACLTAAITLVVVSEYVARLERWAPPPIFVSTDHLLRVIVDEVIESINLPKLNTAASIGSCNIAPVYEVLQTLRIPENGGIHVLLRECKCVQHPNTDGTIMQEKSMEMLWQIQADRWGRIEVLRPGSLEPYSGEKRTFRELGRYSY